MIDVLGTRATQSSRRERTRNNNTHKMYLFFCVLREKLSLSKINTWLATEFQWQAVLLLYGVPIPDNVAIYQRHINRTA